MAAAAENGAAKLPGAKKKPAKDALAGFAAVTTLG